MKRNRLFTAALVIALAVGMVGTAGAQSQSRNQPGAQARTQSQVNCLRALDGSRTNPKVAEAARLRAIVIPALRLSYFGTPAGTVGGKYIPTERFFQDDPTVFGLPTNIFTTPCCITRSK
jgi:hypothetical protein